MSTVRERLARVEERIDEARNDLRKLDGKLTDFKKFAYSKFDLLEEQLSTLDGRISEMSVQLSRVTTALNNINPSLGPKEKATIIVAFITSLTSIIVTLIKVLT